jgi:glycogen debranching enzyme
MAGIFNVRTPGAISEALPDQWCFVQLWSALGILSPVVECFLGIQPNAVKRTLRVVPSKFRL